MSCALHVLTTQDLNGQKETLEARDDNNTIHACKDFTLEFKVAIELTKGSIDGKAETPCRRRPLHRMR